MTVGNPDGRIWVLWDGECGFCRRCVAWAVNHDPHGVLHPVPYQRAPSPPMTPRLYRACPRAVHVVTPDGHVYRAGRAALKILGSIGWGWLERVLSLPPFIWLVEIGYRIVSDNRPFFGRFILLHSTASPEAVGEA